MSTHSNMQGVFLDLESLDRGDLDLSALRASLDRLACHAATTPSEVAERIAEADVVITNKVVLDRALLAAAPRLRLVAVAATGTNNVDLEAAREFGIPVCNVRRYATPSVVQHVFAVLLSLVRALGPYRRAVEHGDWSRSRHFCLLDYPIRELGSLRLGIVGFGELGQAVAAAARGFGMEVLVAARPGGDSRPGRVPLEQLLETVDVLSLHCPLTPETRGLIGVRELQQMHSDAILINTARGGLVDETALASALRSGGIGGAAIDVLEQEPPNPANPLLQPDVPNLLVTPHVAWASREARQRLTDGLAENVRTFRAGEPNNIVNGVAP